MRSAHLLWDCSAARLASTDGGYWPNRSWAWQIRSSYGRSWGMRDRRWWTIAMSHSVCFTSFSLCSTIWGGEGGLKVWNTSGWAVGLPWEQTLILILHAVLSVASVILVRQDECSALKQADEELIPPPPHDMHCALPWRKRELHSALLFHAHQTELSSCPAPTCMHTHARCNCK